MTYKIDLCYLFLNTLKPYISFQQGILLLSTVNCRPYKVHNEMSVGGLELVLKAAGSSFTPSRREWKPKSLEEALLPLMMDDKPKDELSPPSEEPYNFYLPPFYHEDDYNKEIKDTLIPPSTSIDKTNYYATKPKKHPKKYIPGAKQVNLKITSDDGDILYNEPLDELDYYDEQPKKSMLPLKSFLPPLPIKFTDYEDNVSISSVTDLTYLKPNSEREPIKEIKFQFRGMGGPDSYQFGFDSGKAYKLLADFVS